MKRNDRSLCEYPEQPWLQLQQFTPELPRGRSAQPDKMPGAPDRLFAIRRVLLDQQSVAQGQPTRSTRH